MAKQVINIGTVANDGTGDTIREAFNKSNNNFDELYNLIGVNTTVTNITSASLVTQDTSGFVTYINGVTPFSVALNEIRMFHVTDTNQKYVILLRDRSFGTGEPAITSSDVVFLPPDEDFTRNGTRIDGQVSNGGVTPVTIGAATQVTTNGTSTSATTIGTVSNFISLPMHSYVGSASAGQTAYHSLNLSAFIGSGWTISGFLGLEESVLNSAGRTALILREVQTDIGNIEPSAATFIGVGVINDSGDANLQVCYKNPSNVITKIDLGSDFPAQYTKGSHFYRVVFINERYSQRVKVVVHDLITNKMRIESVDISTGVVNALFLQTWRGNAAVAQAPRIFFSSSVIKRLF